MSVSLLETHELTELFGYKNDLSTLRAISRGTFPVRTHKLGRKRYAFKKDVQAYFKNIIETEEVTKGAKRRETNRRHDRAAEMKEIRDDHYSL